MMLSIASHRALAEDLLARWTSGRGPHAVLLAGARGIGKRALARALAAELLDMPETAPEDWVHPDYIELLPDGEGTIPSIGVNTARDACAQLRLTPARGGRRLLLVDASEHKLTVQAANALLKTLEEPPQGAVLLLITHAPGSLPATIRSRCQLLRVPAPAANEALETLKRQKPDLSLEDARALLSLAAGSPGRALELAEGEALEGYAALVEALEGLACSGLDRAAAGRFAAARGGEGWSTAAALVDAFLHRAAVAAAGAPEAEAAKGEAALHQALIKKAGLAGLTQAQALAAKIALDTETQHLDPRYGMLRLLLAIEHGIKAAAARAA